jgi:hypothetical protein
MEPRRASAVLPLPLIVVVLVVFAAGGLGAGALARGFVNSLHTPPTKAVATAPATAVVSRVTPSAVPPTAIPTQAGPDQPFLLQITATPAHVSAGSIITITVVATTVAGNKPVAGLSCVLTAPRSGPPGLLSSWTITTPNEPAGTYGVEVSAAGTDHYSFWKFAVVYVG